MVDQRKMGMGDLMAASGPNGMHAIKMHAFPDVWGDAMGFNVDGRSYKFDGREFLKDILRDPHPEIVCIKGAQLGVTVTALLRTFHRLVEWKWNCLYLLPVKAGTVPFTQGRIDPIVKGSKILKAQFVNVDNANHKRTQTSNLYIRGTNVETELREIPVDCEIWDERDKMTESNLNMARTRMDGSAHKHLFMLSTPTIPDYGVDQEYKASDKRRWFIKCPHCSHSLCLDWDTHVKINEQTPRDSHLECDHCHREITHTEMINASARGQWVPEIIDGAPDVHGYHISQLYSPTRQLYELIRIWMRGQTSSDALKELHNSALGEAFVAEGDKLTEQVLDACRDDNYIMPAITEVKDFQVNLGIDVGTLLHTQASVVLPDGRRRKVFVRGLQWPDLYRLAEDLDAAGIPWRAVIDANPERKQATDFAEIHWGKVFLAYYVDNGDLATWKYPTHRGEVGKVTINRTVGLDTSHATYMRRQVILPGNARDLGEKRRDDPFNGWYKQMMSQVRLIVPNTKNEPVAKYVQTGGADHWDHSDLYEFICSTLVAPPPEELAAIDTVQTAEELNMPDYFAQFDSLVENDPYGSGFWSDGLGPE